MSYGRGTCPACGHADHGGRPCENEAEDVIASTDLLHARREFIPDASRLDWLIANTAWPMEDPGQGWFVAFYESEPQHGFHATARAAIDAAMREGK